MRRFIEAKLQDAQDQDYIEGTLGYLQLLISYRGNFLRYYNFIHGLF